MPAGGWALGAGACDAGAWDGSGTSMVAANGWALGTGAWASAGVLLLVDNPMSGPPTAG